MGRYSTIPTLIDDLKSIDLKDLRKWGYLKPGMRHGTLKWTRHGIKTAEMSLSSRIDENPRIIFDYTLNEQPVHLEVELVKVPSNLGKGHYFQFVCPRTYKLCRKLHLVNGHFMHRSALRYAMYESQTESKAFQRIKDRFVPFVKKDQYYEELKKPYFKKYYGGVPTKKYMKLKRLLHMADQMSLEEYQILLMFGP